MSTEPQVAPGPEQVDQLADEFLGRYRQGQRPSITEYVQAHPDLAHEIRELFPTLVVLERLSPRQEEIALGLASAAPAAMPQQLGEYRILREVGRGGMGVVYEAEHLPLGRHVALKVLLSAAVLNPSVLTRFQNEVRAAARLHHTNIVPVFGVGEDQGTHYYAMQFITGQGLDVVLDELRKLRRGEPATSTEASASSQHSASSHGTSLADYFQGVARMGLQVAEALAHAHSQGVLHRDIKPSNLLLDAQGAVWVTDFGLAKQAGCDVTGTGDVVGTLRYMAPERFGGSSDASSDIYGLGVTLYELLTTEPAFQATDRAQLVHDIAHHEPPALRRLERRVPRDLETIVLKAMAKRPAERYATAAEMAADLRRFLDDKPIAARRLGVVERLWRWSVRRPALASLTAALLVSLVVGVAGICWQWARAETHLEEAVKQKTTAEKMLGLAQVEQRRAEESVAEAGRQESIAKREAGRAEENFLTARRSVNELLTLVSEDDLMDQPGLQPVRLTLLTKAIEFHERMLADRDHDPTARRDLALAHFRLGLLRRQMGPVGAETQEYARAIDLLKAAGQADHESMILLAKVYNSVGLREVDNGQAAAALATLTLARNSIDRVLAKSPDELAAQLVSGMTFINTAYATSESLELDRTVRNEEALRIQQKALDIYRQAAEQKPADLRVNYALSSALSNMARRHAALGRLDESQRLLSECLELRQKMVRRQPASLFLQSQLAAAYNTRGDVVRWNITDRSPTLVEQAAKDYAEALTIQERLALENPAVLAYRQDLAGSLENLSRLYRQAANPQQALHWRRKEMAALTICLELDPQNTPLRARRASQLEGQAELEATLGLSADLLATRRAVREAWRPIFSQSRDIWEPYSASIHEHLSRLMVELGMQDQPAELYEVTLERRALSSGRTQELLTLSSDLQLATNAATRAVVLDLQGQEATARCRALAIALARQAAQIAPREATEFMRKKQHMRRFADLLADDGRLAKTPDDPGLLHHRGRVLQLIGDSLGAQSDWDAALPLLDAQHSAAPDNRQAQRVRALIHFDGGHWDQAIADSSGALALRSDDVTMLACRGRAALRLGQWQRALDDFSRAIALRPERTDLWPLRCEAAFELGRLEEARADAERLAGVAGDDISRTEEVLWSLLAQRQVPRFPEASLGLAMRAGELATQATHRRPLGGVYFQLGRYQEAVDSLAGEVGGPGETAAFAAFWLAMSYQHLGQSEQARQMFDLGVRNWKGASLLTPSRGEFLHGTWQEAKSLLFGSETPAARS